MKKCNIASFKKFDLIGKRHRFRNYFIITAIKVVNELVPKPVVLSY